MNSVSGNGAAGTGNGYRNTHQRARVADTPSPSNGTLIKAEAEPTVNKLPCPRPAAGLPISDSLLRILWRF